MAGSLDLVFVENRQALDRVSRAQLRERFNAWAKRAAKEEIPEPEKYPYVGNSDQGYLVTRYDMIIKLMRTC